MEQSQTGRIADDPRMPRVGYLVADRYQILEVLGQGGFAAVYLARDVKAGGKLALKVLDPAQSDNSTAVDRFRQEVAVVRELSHHNTVKIWDVGSTDTGCVFYAMELVRGEELSELVAREGPLSTERSVRILTQILASLAEAHRRGIIHRDLKPKNIMVSQSAVEPDYVKVLDFGIAKALAPELSIAKTQTGMLLCTPAYAAPELMRGTGVGPSTDLYALGLILIELLTGQPAVQGSSVADLIAQQMMPQSVRLPPGLERHPLYPVIERAIQKEPGRRYPSAEEMLEALRRQAGVAPARPRRGRTSRATLVLGMTLIAVALAGLAALFVLIEKQADVGAGGTGLAAAEGSGTEANTATPAVTSPAPVSPAAEPVPSPLTTPIEPTARLIAPRLPGDAPLPGTRAPPPAGFVRLSEGTYVMGSSPAEVHHQPDEAPHSVTLTRAFYLGSREVTQADFSRVARRNPSAHLECGPDCPVDSVSWYDAIGFANLRSRSEGLTPCYVFTSETGTLGGGCPTYDRYDGWGCEGDYVLSGLSFAGLDCDGYRLPTEAEWEYAARAGTATTTYGGNLTLTRGGSPDPVLARLAWYEDTSGMRPHPVGQLAPNGWALYDLLGNVWEWTNDWYGPYAVGATRDPTGPAWGRTPVVRGSGYNGTLLSVRAAHRYDDVNGVPATYRGKDTGFRLARTVPPGQ